MISTPLIRCGRGGVYSQGRQVPEIEDLQRISEFLNDPAIRQLSDGYYRNLERREMALGFNVFSLISDTYYRENFHSDILRAVLDPLGAHGEGNFFLRKFLEYLKRFISELNPKNYAHAQVQREKGRVDVLIFDKNTKRAIIIENKINGAVDRERQIPRYYEKIVKEGYSCDAIVYLRLNGFSGPNMAGWDDSEKADILKRLLVIPACDGSSEDLCNGWIDVCLESCHDRDVGFLLRHYKFLIKSLAQNIMNKSLLKEFYEYVQEEGVYNVALAVERILGELILYRAQRIEEIFKNDLAPFSKIEIYRGNFVLFTGLESGEAELSIDIIVDRGISTFCFWDRRDLEGIRGVARQVLKEMRIEEQYIWNQGFTKEFLFPSQEGELIDHIRFFKNELSKYLLR